MELTELTQTCFACPSQWDAWVGDDYYYVRYRHGVLTVTYEGELVFHQIVDGMADGVMDTAEMLERTGMEVSLV